MGFQTPQLLLLLLLLPLLWWVYRQMTRQGHSSTHVLHSNLGVLVQAGQVRKPWKRYLPGLLYLLSIGLAIFTLARPQGIVLLPDDLAGVMLAIDVSGSMRNTDINPSRMEAAKKAAQTFVRSLPEGAKVGLVKFAGYAILEQPLTTDRQLVFDRIGQLEMFRGTAIGEGLLESLKNFPQTNEGKLLGPSTVVLLSDGRSNRGIDPMEAVKEAKKMGVKVHTIGLGKRQPDEQEFRSFMIFDEETLKAIAAATDGQYYAAESADALNNAYKDLNKVVGWKPGRTEVSSITGLLAGLMLASSLLLSGFGRKVV